MHQNNGKSKKIRRTSAKSKLILSMPYEGPFIRTRSAADNYATSLTIEMSGRAITENSLLQVRQNNPVIPKILKVRSISNVVSMHNCFGHKNMVQITRYDKIQ